VFFGLLVFGPGVGLAFVTASIAALAGVPEHESGLASGLSNTCFQIGAALGVALVTTVAVSRTDDYLSAHTGASQLVALTEGFQSAFLAVAILAGVGVALALLLLGPARRVPAAPRRRSPTSSLPPRALRLNERRHRSVITRSWAATSGQLPAKPCSPA